MRVREIMTPNPTTVAPETRLKAVAALLDERAITGVPVVDGERLLGVVSQADIIACEQQAENESLRQGLFARFRRAEKPAYAARDAMSAPPITVDSETSAVGAAWLMTTHDITRLPVVHNDRLVGIVTRTDLVRAFARSDDEVRREIVEDVLPSLGLSASDIEVSVENGEVVLAGEVDDERDQVCLPHAVRAVIGVIDVRSNVRARRSREESPSTQSRAHAS